MLVSVAVVEGGEEGVEVGDFVARLAGDGQLGGRGEGWSRHRGGVAIAWLGTAVFAFVMRIGRGDEMGWKRWEVNYLSSGFCRLWVEGGVGDKREAV